jgi:AcrR family transcriptional regulator
VANILGHLITNAGIRLGVTTGLNLNLMSGLRPFSRYCLQSMSRKQPQQLRAQRTRRELLAAARRVFAQLGYEQSTVDQIAQSAGCSKGAYYFHFASKEETLLALLDAWIEERTRQLGAAIAHPPETLAPALAKALSWHTTEEEPQITVEFWSQARRNKRAGDRLADAYRTWNGMLAGALADTHNAGAARAVLALFDGAALHAALDGAAGEVEIVAPAVVESIANAARRSKVA